MAKESTAKLNIDRLVYVMRDASKIPGDEFDVAADYIRAMSDELGHYRALRLIANLINKADVVADFIDRMNKGDQN